ncbi:hypothetical protein [Microvirga zambiensis]|uniref:hypothetical protein n=1 Tax=Microvirga zambiensis TaxID=1402137 RepID=UPI00191D884A
MSRPAIVGIEFVDEFEVVAVVEFVGGPLLVAGLYDRDRDHQGAGELEGVVLDNGKIVRHF